MSESQIDQLKLAEKLERMANECPSFKKYLTKHSLWKESEIKSGYFNLKFDILPLLSDPKVYRVFEFISRNVFSEETTAKVRNQLELFANKSFKDKTDLEIKNKEILTKIEAQKAKNKLVKDKIARLKEAQRQQVEYERSLQSKEYKEVQSRLVLEAHLSRSKRVISNFKKAYSQALLLGKMLTKDTTVGNIKEHSITELAKEFEEIAQEKRWKYLQQFKDSNDPNAKKNIVKQILPDMGQEIIINCFKKLETNKTHDEQSRKFNLQYIMDNVNFYLRKTHDEFCDEILFNFQIESANIFKKIISIKI